ncbi:cyclase [Desulfosarcina alkanivorans]|jgi:kynurenine formamidase|uniref:Cyclase n=1 Tax=Desulfosarcina alkanivorans TaxID=571177 RepID=A0A5K7YSM0_9BACT|nr:cyclase family protein [Desulfosarcina alkanivorans]BBO71310.1 cyclase [Desulfosarcina alkanivorans]
MKIIDLSHFLESRMPVFPGAEPPALEETATIETDGYLEKKITFNSHNGTHIDAPAHIVTGAKTLDQLTMDTFCGEAFLLSCIGAGKAVIDLRDLLPYTEAIHTSDFIIFNTGWSRYWGDDRYFSGYPVLSENAARWLAGVGLKGVGMDTISADTIDSEDLTVHHVLLGAGMVIVENLTSLAALPDRSFLFSCFPLKIKDADGSPVRAVAIMS